MNSHTEALRKILELQGDKPEEIEATLELIKIDDSEKKMDNLRSWVSVLISFVAVTISFFALFIKLK
ncbi:MAG: hypothetical protein PHS54_03330 [Clostridia bacterium]|nr:hypothetical protein [Clostridia bacterium]